MSTDTSETTQELALVKKGKDCIAIVETVCSDLSRGCIDGVEQKLKELEKDAEELAKHAEEKAKEIEEIGTKYEQYIDDIQREIGGLKRQKEELLQHTCELETTLSNKQSLLSQVSNELSSAESQLRDAEYELDKAKRDTTNSVRSGAAIGAFLGTLALPGVGTAFGAVVGAGTGKVINDSEVREARGRVQDCRRRRDIVQAEVNSASSSVFNAQSQISSLTSQCQKLERESAQYNEKVEKMKKAVLFFLEAYQFWKGFQNISKHGANRTAVLQKIISKAKEKEDLNWLDNSANKTVGKTFLDTWVMIESKCVQGAKFVFQIETKYTGMTEISNFESSPQTENDPPHESLDEKEQEKHLIAIENAIQDRGQLDHTLVHGVFVGPPRSGKDSLMKRLLGKKLASDNSPSTGVAETVVHVKVEGSSTFAATVEESSWIGLEYDEEALYLMKTASHRSNINNDKDANTLEERSAEIITNSSEELGLMSQSLEKLSSSSAAQLSSVHKPPIEIFKDAIKHNGLEGLKKQVSKSWSLYLTNTGGQMEFQELLPLLVSGPSFFFITFQLHIDLHQHFSVTYELKSGESSKSYKSSLSILDSILQTLSSISAMGTYVYKGLQRKAAPLRPKVFIIGTHKDLLDKKSVKTEIKRIDQHLQDVIKPTSHYCEGLIQFASESQMIFTVSNSDPDESDFQTIRTAVEKVVEIGDYKMRSPAHWMIYSLVIRQLQSHVESYDKCFAIAKECGIRDEEEFDEALHFIHTKMGLIRHFPHGELKDIVIVDPQILFEKVTELIVETFTFDNVSNYFTYETFKNMGIFNLSDFERISNRTGGSPTVPLFAKLLEHLRIAARFQEKGVTKYFLPCALTHAQPKQATHTSTIPPLIVTFECGYCPKGLFGILSTYLINNEMESDFEWELVTDRIYRDEVCFHIGPYDTVTIRFLPTHLEITFAECNPEIIPRINPTEEDVCQDVRISIQKGIKTVTSAINYINAQHSLTFYCTSKNCNKNPHPAKLKKFKGKLCSLKCDKYDKRAYPLPPKYEKWQLDSLSQILKATANTSQHAESITRLEKQCHTQLYRQLSRYASKWREIGTHLGFLSNELDNIEAKPSLYHEAPKSLLREMLFEWLEWAPGDRDSKDYATLEALKTAVSSAGLGATVDGLTVNVAASRSTVTTCTAHDSSTSAIKSGNKRDKELESTEGASPKRPRLQ